MSAIEQPAAMSGSTTVTRSPVALGQPLRPVGQDVGRFGHEMDAAEGDRPAVGAVGRHLAELIAVALQIGKRDHFVLLIMMAEDQQLRPPFCPNRRNSRLQFVVGERLIGLKLKSCRGLGKRGWHRTAAGF